MFDNRRYNSASTYFKKMFSQRVQKIAIDAGFTCPNRDGSKSTGGCTYCDNQTFKPFYCSADKSIKQQLSEGINFFAKKYSAMQYLAYFQAYSNTYADIEILEKLYSEALNYDKVIGIVIATRPDCVDDEKLKLISEIAKKYYVVIEYGIETTCDDTLEIINRKITFEEMESVIYKTASHNIDIGAHLILGLPNESEEMILNHATKISALPIKMLKLHQLQIIKNTKMALQYNENIYNFDLYNVERYINIVVAFLELLSPQIMIERFTSEAPPDLLLAPNWGGIKNYEIVHKIEKRLLQLDTWQGKLYNK